MRLLLDTTAFWFWYEENPRMTRKARETIRAAEEVYVSLVSFWEIAIKTRLRKVSGGPVLQAGIAGLHAEGLLPLPIDYPHILDPPSTTATPSTDSSSPRPASSA